MIQAHLQAAGPGALGGSLEQGRKLKSLFVQLWLLTLVILCVVKLSLRLFLTHL